MRYFASAFTRFDEPQNSDQQGSFAYVYNRLICQRFTEQLVLASELARTLQHVSQTSHITHRGRQHNAH